MGEFVQEHAGRAPARPLVRRRARHRRGPTAKRARHRAPAVCCAAPCRRTGVSSPTSTARSDAITFANSTVGRGAVRDGHELSRSLPAHAHLADVRARGIRGAEGLAALKTRIAERLVQVPRRTTPRYYNAFAEPDSPALRDSNPSVVVIPGLGLFGFGKDKREARITSEFFVNAIHVMAGANALEDAIGSRRASLPQARRADQAKRVQELPQLRRAAALRSVPDRVLGARGGQAAADAARARVQPQDRRRRRRRQRHRPGSRAADREARRARGRRRS